MVPLDLRDGLYALFSTLIGRTDRPPVFDWLALSAGACLERKSGSPAGEGLDACGTPPDGPAGQKALKLLTAGFTPESESRRRLAYLEDRAQRFQKVLVRLGREPGPAGGGASAASPTTPGAESEASARTLAPRSGGTSVPGAERSGAAGALERDVFIGQRLFNEGLFFDCHEFLEAAWNRSQGKTKVLVQALIQAAAGFHKLEMGNPRGAGELLRRAAQKLEACRGLEGWRLEPLLHDLNLSLERLEGRLLDPSQAPRMEIIGVP